MAVPDSTVATSGRALSYRAGAAVLRTAVIAAAAAAIVGPNLPGARSAALVTWRGGGALSGGAALSTGAGDGAAPGGIRISTLVQVGQEEVDNPAAVLFTVQSSLPTRELIVALDHFDGSSWSASPSGPAPALGPFVTSISADERRPPPLLPDGSGQARLVQVFKVARLTGNEVPTWGNVEAIVGTVQARRGASDASIVVAAPLREGSVYAVRSQVPDPDPAELEAAGTDTSDPAYLQLPGTVPPRLVRLADRLEANAPTPYAKALALEAYLHSQAFHYRLPSRAASGTVTGPGYGELTDFLFGSRTGYCQQFATAFAVLARIEGLPTRVAVGFLPGAAVGFDEWQVEGADTHAWPQVLFQGYGWIDFEPTPGVSVQGSSAPVVSNVTTPATLVPVTTATGAAHNLRPSPGAGGTRPKAHEPVRHNRTGAPSEPWLPLSALALLASIVGLASWRLWLRRSPPEPRSGVLAAWREATRTLDLAGITRRRSETYVELAERVGSAGLLSEEAAIALSNLARLATAACYAPGSPGGAGLDRALRDARTVVRSVRTRVTRRQLVAAVLDQRGRFA